jgi:hypothetical protein
MEITYSLVEGKNKAMRALVRKALGGYSTHRQVQ